MADQKIYTIPLRKEFQKVAFKRRTNKAVRALKEFVLKHTKADVVIVGEELNELIWANGITNPPAKVKVEITKEEKKENNKSVIEAFVNLVGIKKKVVEQKKKGILSKEDSGLKGKLKSAVENLKEAKKESSTEEKTEKDSKDSEEKETKKEEKPKAEAKKVVSKPSKQAEPKKVPAKKKTSEVKKD